MNWLRRLYIFPLARKRLVCRLIGHGKFYRGAVYNLRKGKGWADMCARCGQLRNADWDVR